jgi:hypothetical protein
MVTPIRPEFLMVSPAAYGRLGGDAVALALIRYATSPRGSGHGRVVIDGETWWRASYTEIGDALGGVSRYTVRKIILRLVKNGELESLLEVRKDGDQTRAYRLASDQPSCGSDTASTSQVADRTQQPDGGVSDQQQGYVQADTACVPADTAPGPNGHRHYVVRKTEELPERTTEGGTRERATPAPTTSQALAVAVSQDKPAYNRLGFLATADDPYAEASFIHPVTNLRYDRQSPPPLGCERHPDNDYGGACARCAACRRVWTVDWQQWLQHLKPRGADLKVLGLHRVAARMDAADGTRTRHVDSARVEPVPEVEPPDIAKVVDEHHAADFGLTASLTIGMVAVKVEPPVQSRDEKLAKERARQQQAFKATFGYGVSTGTLEMSADERESVLER